MTNNCCAFFDFDTVIVLYIIFCSHLCSTLHLKERCCAMLAKGGVTVLISLPIISLVFFFLQQKKKKKKKNIAK